MSARALLTDADRFPFLPEEAERLRAGGVELVELEGHDREAVLEAAREADAVFVYHARFDAAAIDRLGRCRVLARCGAGFDNIDVAAARARGVEVTYVPDYGVDDVAEHALALLLTCARRVVRSDAALRDGRWPAYRELGAMHRLRGRTLGVVGWGRIGRAVGERARALGMEVVAHDPALETADVPLLELGELLDAAHAVSLHAPLLPATRHLVGAAELDRLGPEGILINTGRGGLVDEAALAEALRAGRIAGAGLDVFETSPLPADSPLLELDGVVLTPHSAAFTDEALAEVRGRAVDDVLRVLGGEPARDPVPQEVTAR